MKPVGNVPEVKVLHDHGFEPGEQSTETYYGDQIIHVRGALSSDAAADFDETVTLAGRIINAYGHAGAGSRENGMSSTGIFLSEFQTPPLLPSGVTPERLEAISRLQNIIAQWRPLLDPNKQEGDAPFDLQTNIYANHIGQVRGLVGWARPERLLDPAQRTSTIKELITNHPEWSKHVVTNLLTDYYDVYDEPVEQETLYTPGIGNWHTDSAYGQTIIVHTKGSGTLHVNEPLARADLLDLRKSHMDGDYQTGQTSIVTNPGDVSIINGVEFPHMASGIVHDAQHNRVGFSTVRRSIGIVIANRFI